MSLSQWFLMFQKIAVHPSSRPKQSKNKQEGTAILQNIENQSPNDTAKHFQRPESSATRL
jgi:hypothetical protein